MSLSSNSPQRVGTDPIKVTFTDECYSAVITPAVIQDFSGVLYTRISEPITSFGSLDLVGCPTPFYILDGPVAFSANVPASFSINQSTAAIETEPTMLGNVGSYDFVLFTCIEVGSDNQRFCETTSFTATIVDPCSAQPTALIPDGFPNVLSAPLLQSDSLVLSQAI